MSAKELHECHGKNKRLADHIRNPPQASANNSPAKPLKKRHRSEVLSSPPVQFPRRSQPSSSEDTLTWDVGFPLGNLIDEHFGKEKFHEKVKEMGLEKELQSNMADCVRMTFLLLRVIGGMFADIEKENKAFIGEITVLKKLMTSLKDQRDKLKTTLEKSSLEKSQLIAKLKNLMEEISKSNGKLLIKEDAHKITVHELKAEIEELKGEISSQYKVGYDNAVNKFLFFAARLEP